MEECVLRRRPAARARASVKGRGGGGPEVPTAPSFETGWSWKAQAPAGAPLAFLASFAFLRSAFSFSDETLEISAR